MLMFRFDYILGWVVVRDGDGGVEVVGEYYYIVVG